MAEYIGWITSNQTFNDGYLTSPGDSNNLQIHQPPSDQTEPQYINSNFQYLKNLLTEQERKISYLDLYRIDKYLGKDDVSMIGSIFAQLLPCHAIGINAAAAQYHNINLNKGDLLLKAANGEPIRIEAPGNGMYYPQIVVDNNQYYIKWYYTIQDNENETLTGYTFTTKNSQNLNEGEFNHYVNNNNYKIDYNNGSESIQTIDLTSANFEPFKDYKFLLPDQDNNNRGQAIVKIMPDDEDLALGAEWTISNNISVANNFPIVSLYHIRSDDNNNYWEEVCDNTLKISKGQTYYNITMTKNNYINRAVIKIPQFVSNP